MGEAPLRNVYDYGITIDSSVGQMFCKAKLCGQLRSQMKFRNEETRKKFGNEEFMSHDGPWERVRNT